jgi:hypothetical protein
MPELRIQQLNPPEILPARPLRRGGDSARNNVSSADNRSFNGMQAAVKQRADADQYLDQVRSFAVKQNRTQGRYSADRQSGKFGIQKAYNEMRRVEPRPGQQLQVYQDAKRSQQLDIARYEKLKSELDQSYNRLEEARNAKRNAVEGAYAKTQQLYQEVKRQVELYL